MSSDFEPEREIQCEAGTLRIKDRIRELRRVPAKELVPNPRNWRRHSRAQADALRGLLAEVGYADALLVRELPDGRLMLIDGHLRAETTPDLMVPVLVLDVTAEEADTILLTLDPLAAMAESDGERLKKLLEAVRSDEPAVQELMRRTAGEHIWAIVHPTELNEAAIPPERADELKEKWHTEPEELWQAGPHRIACGDSTNPEMISRLWSGCEHRARLLVTDPPYGVCYSEKTKWMHRRGAHRCRKQIANDDLGTDEIGKLFANALRISLDHTEIGAALYATVPGGPLLPVFIEAMNAGGFSFRTLLVWVKQAFVLGRGDYHSRHEPILYGWRDNGPHYFTEDRTQDSVFEVDRPMVSEWHPTTKPIALLARMLSNSSRPGELVFDPFAGSGSTIIAAHQLGRVGLGCELDPGYAAVQLERLSMLGLQPELMSE